MEQRLQHPHYVLFGAVLVISFVPLAVLLPLARSSLLSFDLAATAFLISAILSMRRSSPQTMRARAARNDGGRGWLITATILALAVVLTAVTLETNASGGPLMTKVMPLVTLALAWGFANVAFALHYAHVYYARTDGRDAGGLKMPTNIPPTYLEFCYFAFVIGMTFQVSDIEITGRDIRQLCLAHSLIAFAFNVGVLALSVNIVAGS